MGRTAQLGPGGVSLPAWQEMFNSLQLPCLGGLFSLLSQGPPREV